MSIATKITKSFDGYGGRRFILTLLTLIVSGSLCYHGTLSGEWYAATVIATVGIFIRYNTLEKTNQQAVSETPT